MTENRNPQDYIAPLRMNKLRGRMLRLPAPPAKRREILFVYGHHSTIERWWGIAEVLNKYGAVTMPDLPGFGGMQSFYKIDEVPTVDAYADYLAAFVKLRYSRRRVTIVGMSFGFVVVTRMLQKYPDLMAKVDILISLAGFAHHEDFTHSRTKAAVYHLGCNLLSTRPVAIFFRNVCLHPAVLRFAYTKSGHAKFAYLKPDEQKVMAGYEVRLWHKNDVRTHWYTLGSMLKLDNCNRTVALPVWHVRVNEDQYFKEDAVEQHMRVIFSEFHASVAKLPVHAPVMLTDKKVAAKLIPSAIRRVLA